MRKKWKHFYKEIETFKLLATFLKAKELADKQGQPKTVLQVKKKLKTLKELYSTIDNPS